MKGIYSALLGSFDRSGALNEKGLRATIRHNIRTMGIDGLYVNGSTGENFLLPPAVKRRVFEVAAEETTGQVRLIAQIGSNDFDEASSLVRLAADLKYDAISSVAPFYYKFSKEEIKSYYRALADMSPLPLVIYNIPSLSGVEMTLDDFNALLSHAGIIGVKFTSVNLYQLERLRKAFPDKLLFSGFDEILLSAAVLNVDGAIGSTYNVMGHFAKNVVAEVKAGKIAEALETQSRMNDVIDLLLSAGLHQTLKEVLKLFGVELESWCRKPMAEPGEAHRLAAKKIFEIVK